MFYFKSRDHQWSEAAGVIVLENIKALENESGMDGSFGLILNFASGPSQHLSCLSQEERDSWKQAIQDSSYNSLKMQLTKLQNDLAKLSKAALNSSSPDSSVIDPDNSSVLETSMSCDNLLCDALGRSPSPRLLIFLRNSNSHEWRLYANTEIVEVSQN